MSAAMGLFAIACSLQDVTPLGQIPISEPHALSYVARDGRGAMIGWTGLKGQSDVVLRQNDEGRIMLTGLTFEDSGNLTWAELRPISNSSDFLMEWLMYDHPAKDGRMTVAVWSKGRCERLATDAGVRQ